MEALYIILGIVGLVALFYLIYLYFKRARARARIEREFHAFRREKGDYLTPGENAMADRHEEKERAERARAEEIAKRNADDLVWEEMTESQRDYEIVGTLSAQRTGYGTIQ